MAPDESGWTVTDYLLAAAVDALQGANWQRAGDDRQPRPTPLPRPADLRREAERSQRTVQRAEQFLEYQRAMEEAAWQ